MAFRVFAIIFCIIGIGVIGYGQYHWQQEAVVDVGSASAAVEIEGEEATASTTEEAASLSEISLEDLESSISLLPEEAQDTFLTSYENGDSISLLILGSKAIGDDEGSAQLMKEGIQEAYGEDFITVDTYTYDGTSRNLVEELDTLEELDQEYDLVLVEPFIMVDNGKVGVPENHSNMEELMGHFKSLNEDTVFFFTPALPIFEASIYPGQVEDFKEYAAEEEIPFIDHWSAWPDYNEPEFKDFIDDDGYPNAEGAEIWADEVVGYFTNS
ncbi:SGNH/GDSL hydrolase family protein [Bacillus salacetis]|uniref:SGNH/GDSL hydrolase family protein n=1 Tax=Bacillus salacetis TaxID=2315464 RepID=UPI003BA1D955